MRKPLLFVALLLSVMTAVAQTFDINVKFKNAANRTLTLKLYVNDTVPIVKVRKMQKSSTIFKGSLDNHCYAELSTDGGQTLGFFAENSNITVQFDEDNPELSAITGSHINSQYRYALEQCRNSEGEYDVTLLVEEAMKNKTTLFAPTIIYKYILPNIGHQQATDDKRVWNKANVSKLTEILDGEAKTTYHYRLLNQKIADSSMVTDDGRLPDITFTEGKQYIYHTDSLLKDNTYNVLIVGAKWCKQCRNAYNIVRKEVPNANIILINIDDDIKDWNAEVVKKLKIEHIPYLILIAPDGKIVAKDIRAWEIKRSIK